MARRDQIPPYEIMRSRASLPVTGLDADAGKEAVGPGEEDPTPALPRQAPWWVGSSAPLVLRIPRGLAVLSVLGVLLLIVTAYFVGTLRGAASAVPATAEAGLGDRNGPTGFYIGEEQTFDGPTVAVPEKIVEGRDVRVEGMCYLRLMESTEADCRRLAEFMASRGVAIQLVKGNNGRFVAYVIDRAYRPDEKDSESAQYYLRQMKQHGREWKIHTGGQNDLSSMYLAQYVNKKQTP